MHSTSTKRRMYGQWLRFKHHLLENETKICIEILVVIEKKQQQKTVTRNNIEKYEINPKKRVRERERESD